MSRWILMLMVLPVMALAAGCEAPNAEETYCSNLGDCASKSGQTFSVSACERQMAEQLDGFGTVGCKSEARSFISCVADQSCNELIDNWNNNTTPFECGAKANTLNKCL
jgi:hypothetical protein